ncbi:hypothetical protein HDE_13114 [Halotydeus destructor]|nr:hypothetical protein HDE_13114 [Halotydeus destructor]
MRALDLRKVVSDGKDGNEDKDDSSVKQLEKYLLKYRLISTSISNLKNGVSDTRYQWYTIYRMFLDFMIASRYLVSLILAFTKSPKYMTWCQLAGEYDYAYGKDAIFIYFYGACFYSLTGFLRLTMFLAEKRGQLQVITWFDGLKNGNFQDLGLTRANVTEIRKAIRVMVFLLRICDRLWLGCMAIHAVPLVIVMMGRPPIHLALYYTFWFFFAASCYSQIWGVKSIMPFICYLSYVYFKLKYGQIRGALERYMALTNRQNIASDSRLLMRILRKYNALAGQVANHNAVIKWVLGINNYICGPLAAISLYVIMTATLEVPYIKQLLVIMSMENVFIIFLFAMAASGLNSVGMSCYPILTAVQIKKRLPVETKRYVSKSPVTVVTQSFYEFSMMFQQILNTLSVMGGEYPVAYYFLNMGPYVAISFQEFVADSLTLLFLIAGTVQV